MKVLQAINLVKLDLAAHGGITKDRRAPEQIGGYAFRGIDDLDNVLCGLTAKYGLVLVPEVLMCRAEIQQDARGKMQRHVEITLRLDVVHEDGSKVTVASVGEGIDGGDKATGKAFSNARKMACFGLFQIPTHGENVEEYATEVAPPVPAQAQLSTSEARAPRNTRAKAPADPVAVVNTAANLAGLIPKVNTFAVLYSALQDIEKLTEDERPSLVKAVHARALDLLLRTHTEADVKESIPLANALNALTGNKGILMQVNARYIEARNAAAAARAAAP